MAQGEQGQHPERFARAKRRQEDALHPHLHRAEEGDDERTEAAVSGEDIDTILPSQPELTISKRLCRLNIGFGYKAKTPLQRHYFGNAERLSYRSGMFFLQEANGGDNTWSQ